MGQKVTLHSFDQKSEFAKKNVGKQNSEIPCDQD